MIKHIVNFPETECSFGLVDIGPIPIQRQRDVATGLIRRLSDALCLYRSKQV